MTQVVFDFLHPNGLPRKNTTFAIVLRRPGFVEAHDGVVVPDTIEATTDDQGQFTLTLQPSSSVYKVTIVDLVAEENGEFPKVSYQFYVPDTTAVVRAQDLFMAPPPSDVPWDEAAILKITKAVADAKGHAEESAASAAEAAEYAGTFEQFTERSEAAAADSLASANKSKTSADQSAGSATASAGSAAAALTSQNAAKTSETNSKTSETNSNTSKNAAAGSATASAGSASAALTSQNAAKVSQDAAKASQDAAKTSETNSGNSATASSGSATASAASAAASLASQNAAKTSETNSKTSETNSKTSETNSSGSAAAALASKNAAATSETNANTSKNAAAGSATTASTAAGTATTKAAEASTSAGEALASKNAAKTSETNSKTSETNSKASELLAKQYSEQANPENFAPQVSPLFTGDPRAPTPVATDEDTSIATTAFVRAAMGLFGLGSQNLNILADMNSFTTRSGVYYADMTSAGVKPADYGVVFVTSRANGSNSATWANQTFYATNNGKIYNRFSTNLAAWSAWEESATNSFVLNQITASLNLFKNAPNFNGEVTIQGMNVERYVNSDASYGLISRMDTGAFYLLLTNQNDPLGNFNALRPFSMNLASGQLAFGNGATVLAPAVSDRSARIPSTNWVGGEISGALNLLNLGATAPAPLTFSTPLDWAKPNGWSGFINLDASFTAGGKPPTNNAGTASAFGYGMWTIMGKRDNSNGYTGLLSDYASGRMFIGSALVGTDNPTWREVTAGANFGVFGAQFATSTSQADARNWLNMQNVINVSTVAAALKLSTARTIALTGAVTGSVAFDGSGNVSIATTLAALGISSITGLQAALDAKQNSLGYEPVQKGTGPGQGTNAIKIGWGASNSLLLAVDATDFANSWPINISRNAATATALANARNIALTGDVTGTVSFNGTANVSIATTIADLDMSKVSGLSAALGGKANVGASYSTAASDSRYLRIDPSVVRVFNGTVPALAGATSAYANNGLLVNNNANNSASAVMAFVREGVFGSFFGLNTDNELAWGGWSHGNIAYRIWSEKNFTPANYFTKNETNNSYLPRNEFSANFVATSADQRAGNTGTYVFARNLSGGELPAGAVVGGGLLGYSDGDNNANGALSGSWRTMGRVLPNASTLFLRYG